MNKHLSFQAATTIPAYRIVKQHSTAGYVALDDTSTTFPIGITSDTVLDTSAAIPVVGPGSITKCIFGDSCAVGSYFKVSPTMPGHAAPIDITGLTVTGSHQFVCGILLGPAKVEVTGTVADVFFAPFAVR